MTIFGESYYTLIKDYKSLLIDCNTVDIHVRNLKLLVTEVFKSLHSVGPSIMHDLFTENQSIYKLRYGQTLELPLYNRYYSAFGVNTFDFRAAITWNRLPSSIKALDTLNSKNVLKSVLPKCTCNICR